MREPIEPDSLKKYLLGKLSPGEIEDSGLGNIETEMSKGDFLGAEARLIEDFLEGNLSDEEEDLFHKNFLVSKRRRRRLKFVRQLKDQPLNPGLAKSGDLSIKNPRRSFLHKFVAFSWSPLNFIVLIIVGFVCVSIAWVLLSDGDGEHRGLEKQYADLNSRDFSNMSELDQYTKLELFGGSLRSANGVRGLKKKELTRRVLFFLALPEKRKEESAFKVDLLKDEAVIFSQTGILLVEGAAVAELRFFLPSSILERGNYRLLVSDSSNELKPIYYSFSVN